MFCESMSSSYAGNQQNACIKMSSSSHFYNSFHKTDTSLPVGTSRLRNLPLYIIHLYLISEGVCPLYINFINQKTEKVLGLGSCCEKNPSPLVKISLRLRLCKSVPMSRYRIKTTFCNLGGVPLFLSFTEKQD